MLGFSVCLVHERLCCVRSEVVVSSLGQVGARVGFVRWCPWLGQDTCKVAPTHGHLIGQGVDTDRCA